MKNSSPILTDQPYIDLYLCQINDSLTDFQRMHGIDSEPITETSENREELIGLGKNLAKLMLDLSEQNRRNDEAEKRRYAAMDSFERLEYAVHRERQARNGDFS